MNYRLYQLDFYNGVRFGKGNLDSTDMTFHADTFFSAIFQEALKLGKETAFLEQIRSSEIVFSDAFPYCGNQYFIPKPLAVIVRKEEKKKGDSSEKKRLKNMKYIAVECVEDYMRGAFPKEHMADLENLGEYIMKVSVGIFGNEEPQPYRVSAFYFNEGNGLYLIAGFEKEENRELFEELLDSLSYTGLGGKRSSGLGRFEYLCKKVPQDFREKLEAETDKNILLSAALPEESELENVLEDASYMLLKRGGFVDSQNYAGQQMRKKERYVFAPGSCFKNRFKGTLVEEKNGGKHPVFRYEAALFMGVKI